jgi:hypothetical protein
MNIIEQFNTGDQAMCLCLCQRQARPRALNPDRRGEPLRTAERGDFFAGFRT